ncbi:MAG: O-antigen ligase family protein [Ignavibacteria bacterium]|nr:O-antigen ligase family protein [Ignavibacteria bacterium]
MRLLLTLIAFGGAFGFFHVIAIGTFGMGMGDVFEICVILYVGYYTIWLGNSLEIPQRIETYGLVAMLGIMLLSAASVVVSGNTEMGIQTSKTLAHFLYLWLFAFLAYCVPIPPETWVKVLRFQLMIALIVAVYGLYQIAARPLGWPFAWIEISNASFSRGTDDVTSSNQLALQFGGFFRATSFFSEPSALAAYSASALSLLLVPLFRGSQAIIRSRTLFWIVLVGTMLGVFIAFSITGVLLTSCCIGVCMVLYWKRAWKKLILTLGVSALIIVGADSVIHKYLAVSVVEMFTIRIGSIIAGNASGDSETAVIGESMSQRVDDYQVSYEVMKEYPFFGAGPGNFGKTLTGKQNELQFPSTTYGSVAAELGGVGFVIFLSFLLIIVIRTFLDERKWTEITGNKNEAVETLLPFITIRILFVMLIGVAGNSFVSGYFWTEVLMVLSIQSGARRAMGIERVYLMRVVKAPWRELVLKKQMGTN